MDPRTKTRLLDIRNITVDPEIQSRVGLDREVAREFSAAMLRGDQFPPLDVFEDPAGKGRYMLADGFHRHDAYRAVGRRDVRCCVHEGGRRDARIFSAGANRQFSAKRTPDDIRKSIRMLLEDDEWFLKNDAQIAAYVGCAGATVKRTRLDYCREARIEPPAEFEAADGSIRPAARHFSVSRRPTAAEELRIARAEPARYSLEYTYVRDLFHRFGFRSVVEHGMGARYPGIRAIHHDRAGIVATPCDFVLHDSLPMAVGRVLIAGRICGGGRLVVIGYRDDGPSQTVAHAEELGIEFVSPEDLIAEMKRADASPKRTAYAMSV